MPDQWQQHIIIQKLILSVQIETLTDSTDLWCSHIYSDKLYKST